MGDKSAPILERRSEDTREPVRQPTVVNNLLDAAESEKPPLDDGVPEESENANDTEEEAKPGAWGATKEGLKAFWKWFTKPIGFFVTIYMLNGSTSPVSLRYGLVLR
jgi:hypothetical protein